MTSQIFESGALSPALKVQGSCPHMPSSSDATAAPEDSIKLPYFHQKFDTGIIYEILSKYMADELVVEPPVPEQNC